jgi:radical SAM superfamily enzyme YgiQ (UPF0313 family)
VRVFPAAKAGLAICVGLVQIGELIWQRRPPRQFSVVEGDPQPVGVPSAAATNAPYLPHAIGLLQAYVQERAPDPDRYRFLPLIHRRVDVASASSQLSEADVVGFSCYVWNERLSLAIARRLKERSPGVLIVFGGPQVPDHPEAFLRSHPWIDVVCHGEGERTFLDVLQAADEMTLARIESVSFIDQAGAFVQTPRRERLRDLDESPSPFLVGVFDGLIAGGKQQWLVSWETNRGCPFSCSFCDWGSATGTKVSRYGLERLEHEAEWFAEHQVRYLFICDANFGMLRRDVEIAQALVDAYARKRLKVVVSIQNPKNRTDHIKRIQKIFSDSRVVTLSSAISLQAVAQATLAAVNRENISLSTFRDLQEHYWAQGLETYTELILGLPGETCESFMNGVCDVIRAGQFNRISFYDCAVLPNAPMADPGYRLAHQIETVSVALVHPHEPVRNTDDETQERLEIIIATRTMGRGDWVQAKAFLHFVELLYVDRLLHIPILLMGQTFGISYRRIFDAFLHADPTKFRINGWLKALFQAHACGIQNGRPQFIPRPDCLGLWWPADQHALICLGREGLLDEFYQEALDLLAGIASGSDVDPLVISDAVRLNRLMLALPFIWSDETAEFSYSVASAYADALRGGPAVLERIPNRCVIEHTAAMWFSWEDWCEALIRRGPVPAGYLRKVRVLEDVADHAPLSMIDPARGRSA